MLELGQPSGSFISGDRNPSATCLELRMVIQTQEAQRWGSIQQLLDLRGLDDTTGTCFFFLHLLASLSHTRPLSDPSSRWHDASQPG